MKWFLVVALCLAATTAHAQDGMRGELSLGVASAYAAADVATHLDQHSRLMGVFVADVRQSLAPDGGLSLHLLVDVGFGPSQPDTEFGISVIAGTGAGYVMEAFEIWLGYFYVNESMATHETLDMHTFQLRARAMLGAVDIVAAVGGLPGEGSMFQLGTRVRFGETAFGIGADVLGMFFAGDHATAFWSADLWELRVSGIASTW